MHFSPQFAESVLGLEELEALFKASTHIIQMNRNTIKQVQIGRTHAAIKAFKIPNALQGFIYRFFRASKARRSFEYAEHLQKAEVGTPAPIAYVEVKSNWRLVQSYYISECVDYDCLIRDALALKTEEDKAMVKAFARFSYELHEKGIEHLDFSTGNILIRKNANARDYEFFLVDINRMRFRQLNTKQRLHNFMRISEAPEVVAILAEVYAEHAKLDYAHVYKTILHNATRYRAAFNRKRELKYSLGIKKRPAQ